jgi:hypothetical protein
VADDVQPQEPPAALLVASRRVARPWLHRITVEACLRGGVDHAAVSAELESMVERTSERVLVRLDDLLATDVDEQRTTPLTLFREAVREPTAFLQAHGATPPPIAPAASVLADDVYGLCPATWSDIDPSLHEPGLLWGAWKAMTVLTRRRDAGLR